MDFMQWKEKAEVLVRPTSLLVDAEANETPIAYINEGMATPFIVKHDNQWMALRENQDDDYTFEAIDLDTVCLMDYRALGIKSQTVYPNFEHLLHFGDQQIKDWILANACDSNNLFDLQSMDDDGYIDFWMESHPMYTQETIYGYIGGWAMIWPEDDVPLQWDSSLDFLFQIGIQKEPFIEIYYHKSKGAYICIARNT